MAASQRFVDNGDGTITDQLTGLMWLQDAGCMFAQYPTWEVDGWADGWVPWSDALQFIRQINNGTLSACGAGHTDWRLPNVIELESLADAGQNQPSQWLVAAGFMRVEANDYWTSTTYANSPTVFAYTVNFDDGGVSALGTKNSVIISVWPVRGSTSGSTTELWVTGQSTSHAAGDDGDLQQGVAWPSPRFTDNGDGTVTDNLTGLMWLQDADTMGINAWTAALAAADQFNSNPAPFSAQNYTATYTDWRVPNRKEILSLADFSQTHPALQTGHPLLNVSTTAPYWTSSTYAANPQRAWLGDLRTGELSTELKANGYRMILVR